MNAETVTSAATSDAPETKAERHYDLFVSPEAARKIKEALAKRKTPNASLRVGVRGGGCSGFSYVLEFADAAPREGRDLVYTVPVDDGEVRVICDKKSILYLAGSTLEWEKTLKWQGFKFTNPKAESACGCKESFSI
ncbi:MAG: iron-sulfur cluster assembly accessory protein [Deltaproteobacteria bacterium]|nr:iron-sulfur cluster assembly accessory protein [Deltaproteobacteria bacterium]